MTIHSVYYFEKLHYNEILLRIEVTQLKLENVKLSFWKYRMKSCTLIIGSGKKAKKYPVETDMIQNMQIINDYEKSYFPFFTMTLQLPNATYRTLTKRENSANAKMKIHLQRGRFQEAINLTPSKSISFKDTVKGTFHVVVGPKEQDLSVMGQEKAEKDSNQYGQLSTITVSLYKEDYFNRYDLVINAVLQNVTLMDTMVYCFNKAGIKNVLVSPPSNTKLYSEFRLIPISLCDMLNRIGETYAFHKKGSIVYFDLTRAYVIDKTSACTAYARNEYKTSYIAVSIESQSTRETGGMYANTKKKFYVLNAIAVDTSNTSDTTNKFAGKNIVSVNSQGKVSKTNKKASKVNKVVIQQEGESTIKSVKRALKETKGGFESSFNDINIMALSPNKQFVVSAEGTTYKKFNGKYRLVASTHIFSRDGEYFTVTSTGKFAK